MRKNDLRMAQDVFGDLNRYCLQTNANEVNVGDTVTLINSNCEFEFDNITGCFSNDCDVEVICELELVDVDYSDFVPDKSNNGGCYAFADATIKKILDLEVK
ncbi:hypothetical protein [Methanobrevibacter sp.]